MPIVGIERAFNDPAVGLRCIDHCPLAAAYCNVTVINDYISAFDVVDIVVALIAGAAAPHVTRHVACEMPALLMHQYTKPEQSNTFGPFPPRT